MKCFTVWALIIVLGGCTTLRPIGAEPLDFARRIASGELLKVGDHVVIETKDRQTYEFDVTSLSATSIDGKRWQIPTDQVVSLEKRVVNGKKTALVVAGVAFEKAVGPVKTSTCN